MVGATGIEPVTLPCEGSGLAGIGQFFQAITTDPGFSARRLHASAIRVGSVKVKRLFFFLANRHNHAWRKRIDRQP